MIVNTLFNSLDPRLANLYIQLRLINNVIVLDRSISSNFTVTQYLKGDDFDTSNSPLNYLMKKLVR